MASLKLLLGLSAAGALAACASGGADLASRAGSRGGFSELGFARARAPTSRLAEASPAQAATAAPRGANAIAGGDAPPPSSPPVRLPGGALPSGVLIAEAGHRVDAFLQAEGFSPEDVAQGLGDKITATRMTAGAAPVDEADCALHALARPQMYATNLAVSLSPVESRAGTLIQLDVDARFTVMDVGVVSGALTKHVCRSRGVLEAAVRRAALGGASIGPPSFSGG